VGKLYFLEEVPVSSYLDERGNLGVSELGKKPNFEVKRIYYMNSVPEGAKRGAHGHKELQQIFYALKGSFSLTVTDGEKIDTVRVNELSNGYFVPAGLWRDLDAFTSDGVCLVLASAPFDNDDYIYDFEDFKRWRASQ
jgi:mannose-6-phosphate isomerase-like protein (cupin superfamily)